MTKKKLSRVEQAFEKALMAFDFVKVAAYMVLTNHQWPMRTPLGDDEYKVPRVEQMVEACRSIFSMMNHRSRWISASTGGFAVTLRREDNQYEVAIQFVIEEATRVA
jgi:hypothetical protein